MVHIYDTDFALVSDPWYGDTIQLTGWVSINDRACKQFSVRFALSENGEVCELVGGVAPEAMVQALRAEAQRRLNNHKSCPFSS